MSEEAKAEEQMAQAADSLEKVRQMVERNSKQSSTSVDAVVCPQCFGTGMEVVRGKGARPCACRMAAFVAERVIKWIPPRYRDVTLEGLKARTDLHPSQLMAVELIKSHPTDSFVICGKYGTGKTYLMYALCEAAAHDPTRQIVACTMRELFDQYYAAFNPQSQNTPDVMVRPSDLAQDKTPYSLFLDDIDKTGVTEFTSAQILALFNAAYNFRHQLVITTQKSPDDLKAHFERTDEMYGGAIVRRIVNEEVNLIELF